MKELSIEEKAKRYDEVIERANSVLECKCKNVFVYNHYNQKLIEYLLPELAESEDERMMNQLHSWMKEFGGAEEYTEKVYQWIKGLIEKQGNNMGISEVTKQKLEDNLNKALEKETPESWSEFLDEQKPAWSEEDSNMLQSILDEYKSMAIEKRNWLKSLKDRYTWMPSDEQMNALSVAVKHGQTDDPDALKKLLELLKKLREE